MISAHQSSPKLPNAATGLPAGSALEHACNQLKTAGLRITQPRIAILSALINRKEPVTIDQLHQELKDSSCDLVTVYRCLAAFEDLGLVRRCFFHNGTSLYQMHQGDQPVYHVVGKNGAILDTIPPCLSVELNAVLVKIETELKRRGHLDVSHMTAFFAETAGRPAATTD